jgi:Gpi18-like mannosyltransferase
MKVVICIWIGLSALTPVFFIIEFNRGYGSTELEVLLLVGFLYLLPYIVHKLRKQA